MLHIVMDSGGDLPEEWLNKYEIAVVPINVHMGDEVYLEDVNLNSEQFYRWVKETGLLGKAGKEPTIVSPVQYKNRFRDAMERYFLMVPDKFTR